MAHSIFDQLDDFDSALEKDIALANQRKQALAVMRDWKRELDAKEAASIPSRANIPNGVPTTLTEAVRRAVAMLTEFDVREVEDYIGRALGYDIATVVEPRTKIANILGSLKNGGAIEIVKEGRGPVPNRYRRVTANDL
ncbi:MAG: hypothetical protein JNN20_18475 [Betaproteobacteria bacterium]|nr:hypothetical protein [Betaproteobacteria bacterium]